jgi:hypothetical protein
MHVRDNDTCDMLVWNVCSCASPAALTGAEPSTSSPSTLCPSTRAPLLHSEFALRSEGQGNGRAAVASAFCPGNRCCQRHLYLVPLVPLKPAPHWPCRPSPASAHASACLLLVYSVERFLPAAHAEGGWTPRGAVPLAAGPARVRAHALPAACM